MGSQISHALHPDETERSKASRVHNWPSKLNLKHKWDQAKQAVPREESGITVSDTNTASSDSRMSSAAIAGDSKSVKLSSSAATNEGRSTPKSNHPPKLTPGTPMPAAVTVPCQYRTGKTLGSGTYAIVKEAIHIKTGQYYACKVINKKLMEGREHMVRNEIAVLKRVSRGYRNIVTLHDYFETSHNLYLVFDLCTGGELFDRICAKGNYSEPDAAGLVRTIMKAVKYVHDCGIVHRDLKPENLLFRTPAEDSDIMVADFGLSRVMEDQKLTMLTEVCGTPGYMAPEIFQRTGHGKPVDIWAMGVITYFLLAGYTPFDRDTQQQETEAICTGDYKFAPPEFWAHVSDTGRDFVKTCLTLDPAMRPTATQALQHKWLADEKPHFVPDQEGSPTNLLPHIQKHFDARKTFRKAVLGVMAMRRMTSLATHPDPAKAALKDDLAKFKAESEKEVMENASIVHHHNHENPSLPSSPNMDQLTKLTAEDEQPRTPAKPTGSSSQSPPKPALTASAGENGEQAEGVAKALANSSLKEETTKRN